MALCKVSSHELDQSTPLDTRRISRGRTTGGISGAALGALVAFVGYTLLSAQAQATLILMGWLLTASSIPGLSLALFVLAQPSEAIEALTVPPVDMGAFALVALGALIFTTASVLTALELSRRR